MLLFANNCGLMRYPGVGTIYKWFFHRMDLVSLITSSAWLRLLCCNCDSYSGPQDPFKSWWHHWYKKKNDSYCLQSWLPSHVFHYSGKSRFHLLWCHFWRNSNTNLSPCLCTVGHAQYLYLIVTHHMYLCISWKYKHEGIFSLKSHLLTIQLFLNEIVWTNKVYSNKYVPILKRNYKTNITNSEKYINLILWKLKDKGVNIFYRNNIKVGKW